MPLCGTSTPASVGVGCTEIITIALYSSKSVGVITYAPALSGSTLWALHQLRCTCAYWVGVPRLHVQPHLLYPGFDVMLNRHVAEQRSRCLSGRLSWRLFWTNPALDLTSSDTVQSRFPSMGFLRSVRVRVLRVYTP